MNITTRMNEASTAIQPGMDRQTDAVTKSIQKKIANAQQELQDLSADAEMSIEEKMKKRQALQQEIANLNQQLRQHQMEQMRKERQKASSMEDMVGGTRKSNPAKKKGKDARVLSQAAVTVMISADGFMKQAQVQGAVTTAMEGKAGVLESEIKMDQGRGGNTEAKEAELADLQGRIQATTASQISTLADAGSTTGTSSTSQTTEEYLSYLRQKYSDVNITVADFSSDRQLKSYMFSCNGYNNIAISSSMIEKMASDPAMAAKYEKVIADVPNAAQEMKEGVEALGHELLACGTVIDRNGKVSYWGIGKGKTVENPGTVYKEKVQKQLEEKRAEKKEKEKAEEKKAEKEATEEKRQELWAASAESNLKGARFDYFV